MKKILTKIMNWMLPSCKEVSHLTSQALDESLSLKKRLAMSLHIKMCEWCKRNQDHLILMKNMSANETSKTEKEINLSDEARKRISKFLKNK
jgi:hypothetical protein